MTSEIRFEWDARKAASNKRKHGIDFETAAQVFDDPHLFDNVEGDEHGEVRCRATGKVRERLLFVSYASFEEGGEEVVRIISARKATPQERRAYERNSEVYR